MCEGENCFRIIRGFALAACLSALLPSASQAATRFVAQGGSHTAPFTSWAAAASNIQAAIDLSTTNDVVLVSNGVYQTGGRAVFGSMTNRIVIRLPVHVRSVNGPRFTIIKGAKDPLTTNGNAAIRCAYLGAGASLSGFTLTNGHTRADGDMGREQSGGGAWCETGGVLSNCVLAGNSAGHYGGGSYGGTLFNCVVSRNAANYSGGSSYGLLNNCLLSGNSAVYRGGGSGDGTLNNCTLTGNTAGEGGGGSYFDTLNNCIVYFNTGPLAANSYISTLTHCCTTPESAGTGNIAADPELADAGHLHAFSPCIGAGSPLYAGGTDLDGEAWASPPSIGCDEVQTGSLTGGLGVAVTASFTNTVTEQVVDFTAHLTGRVRTIAWNFGDGAAASNRTSVGHAFAATGVHDVVLTARNDDLPAGVAATVRISVTVAPVHYVKASNATPVFPFASWATAATNIQDAIDAATIPGARIFVSNGVYRTGGRAVFGSMTNRIALTKPVAVVSVNGPAVTFIAGAADPASTNGAKAVRCAYVGTNACLSGFTLTNGHTHANGDATREQSGGGAWCEAGAVVSNCVLTGNTAKNYGGGAYQGTLHDCTFRGNKTYGDLYTSYGGAAYAATLNRCLLDGNWANIGGGTYEGTLNGCTLSGNTAGTSGGGAYYSALNNCTLAGNSAPFDGGGSFGGTLNNCVLTGNTAANGGGASGGTLRNCALTMNTASYGGGWMGGAPGPNGGALINCTLTGNTALEGGGSYYGNLFNCIVYFNKAAVAGNYHSSTLGNSCTTPLPPGEGNITNDPLLAGVWHVSANSPCIGAGSAAQAVGSDLDGEGWANPPSMGCDELRTGAAGGGLGVAISASFTNVSPGVTIDFAAFITGRVTASVWDFGDGSVVSNRPILGHAFAGTGDFPVTLTAVNESHPAGVGATVIVHSVSQPTHYVRPANATPVFPFNSWATAATNIQQAIDAATEPGALVLVSNGFYATGSRIAYSTMNNRIVITNAITVRSVNGPAVTCIAGGGSTRCAFVGANATLSGFTLTNGITSSYGDTAQDISGGAVWCAFQAVVSNCTICSSTAAYEGGGAAGGGTLNDCTLYANYANYGGAAADVTLNRCTLVGNTGANSGGGTTDCVLNRCRVTGNHSYIGGGTLAGTLNNCLVMANNATYSGGANQGTLNNCTLVANWATSEGGGASYATMNNCIVYSNSAPLGPNHLGSTLSYSCTTPAPGGTGNITNNPRFVSVAATNVRLQAGSPCFDRGNNALVQGARDFDGWPRVSHGTVDMGAYEFQGYWAWSAAITNGLTNDLQSATGDGYPNLLKYATGSSPTNSDTLARMEGAPATNGGLPALRFRRNTNATDVTLIAERSNSLTNNAAWSGIATNINGSWGGALNVTETGTGSPVTVNVRDTSASATNRYLRLRVTRP